MANYEKIIAVSCIPGLTTEQRVELVKLPMSVEELFRIDVDELGSLLSVKFSSFWKRDESRKWYESFLNWLDKDDHHISWCGDSNYPSTLLDIPHPPFLLCYRGLIIPPEQSLSVVGTRNGSERALIASFVLGLECADSDTLLVSGYARGIDRMAHEGCVAAGGITWAILASGLGLINNRDITLINRMIDNGGACISEFHPLASPLAWRFPLRNRIIAGLSPVTVVVQAPRGSGALITANHALRQGREVVVHKVGVSGQNGTGTKLLVQEGASVVETLSEISRCTSVPYKLGRAVVTAKSGDDSRYPYRIGAHRFGFGSSQ